MENFIFKDDDFEPLVALDDSKGTAADRRQDFNQATTIFLILSCVAWLLNVVWTWSSYQCTKRELRTVVNVSGPSGGGVGCAFPGLRFGVLGLGAARLAEQGLGRRAGTVGVACRVSGQGRGV